MRKFFLICLVLFHIVACNKDKPGKDIIIPETLVPVLVDLHLLYAIQSEPTFRTIALQFDSVETYTYVFDKHDVTKVEFDSTIAWYTRHPTLFTGIYDEVVMQLTRIFDSIDSGLEY